MHDVGKSAKGFQEVLKGKGKTGVEKARNPLGCFLLLELKEFP